LVTIALGLLAIAALAWVMAPVEVHALERGRDPFAETNPIEHAAQSYLEQTDGNPSAALRLAIADVLTLNHLAAEVSDGVAWGFLRKSRSEVFAFEAG